MNTSARWLKFIVFGVFAGGMFYVGNDVGHLWPGFGDASSWGLVIHAFLTLGFGWMLVRYLRTAKDTV